MKKITITMPDGRVYEVFVNALAALFADRYARQYTDGLSEDTPEYGEKYQFEYNRVLKNSHYLMMNLRDLTWAELGLHAFLASPQMEDENAWRASKVTMEDFDSGWFGRSYLRIQNATT